MNALRDRPWHVAMAALALGLGLAPYPQVPAAGVAAGLGCVVAGLASAPLAGALAAALVLSGAAAGDLRLDAIDAPAARVRDGESVTVRAWLVTPIRPGRFGSSAEVTVSSGPLRGARLLMRTSQWAPLPRHSGVGEGLTVRGTLTALRPHAEAYEAQLRRRGLAAELYARTAHRDGNRRGGVPGALDAARRRAETGVEAGLDTAGAELVRGMVLGEDQDIDPGVRQDFRDSGLAHLLAVSGQNVVLLAALALPLLALAGLGARARLLGLLLLTALYVPLAGAGPALQRAGVMGAAGIAATAASRPGSGAYALLLAAAVTLVANPRAAGDPGWQLSFAAVAGIIVLAPPLRRGMASVLEALRPGPAPARAPVRVAASRAAVDGVAMSVAATVATAPLLALHFGRVPLAGLGANLFALPAVAPVMWLGMAKAAVGQLVGLGPPVAPLALALASALGWVAGLPLGYLSWVARAFADVPGGVVTPPVRSPLTLAMAYGLLLAAWAGASRLLRRGGDRAQEAAGAWRRMARTRRAALAAVAVAALLLAGGHVLGPPRPPRGFTVRFLDVGQGDATLIQDPSGAAILFDAGPPEAAAWRLVRRAGVRRLSAVVATHPSRDHHGGLVDVLDHFPVGVLFDGGDGTPDAGFRAVESEADRLGIRRVVARAGTAFAVGSISVRVLSPPPRPTGPPPEDPNPRGIVAVVSSGDFDLLLSADAESVALLPLALPDVDAMKVPHHGSADPGLPEVLGRLRPEVAAIEVGEGNTYGHPTPSTLHALIRAGARTYRTDRDGTVSLTVEDGEMRVDTER